jgi:hypothetical protein
VPPVDRRAWLRGGFVIVRNLTPTRSAELQELRDAAEAPMRPTVLPFSSTPAVPRPPAGLANPGGSGGWVGVPARLAHLVSKRVHVVSEFIECQKRYF